MHILACVCCLCGIWLLAGGKSTLAVNYLLPGNAAELLGGSGLLETPPFNPPPAFLTVCLFLSGWKTGWLFLLVCFRKFEAQNMCACCLLCVH